MLGEDWTFEVLSFLAILLIAYLISRLARRFFPLDEVKPIADEEHTRIEGKEWWFSLLEISMFIPAVALSTYVIARVLQFLAGIRRSMLIRRFEDDIVFLYTADSELIYWLLPGFFLGILVGGYSIVPLLRRVAGGDYEQLERLDTERLGYDPKKFMPFMILGFVFVSGLAIFAFIDFYFVFTGDRLVENGVLQVQEAEHPYSELTEVRDEVSVELYLELAEPSGQFLAHFGERYVFSTSDLPKKLSESELQDLRTFLEDLVPSAGEELQRQKD